MRMKKGNNQENFKSFKIPENYFNKLFEFTGSSDESSKGFIVAYVNQEGCPLIYAKIASPIVQMGLIKALENYLDDMNNSDDGIDMASEE
tara:strand:+ start:1204 stop:1473 length:270 start_codon:yes stop_codon:yes gene_type:complete